MIVSKGTYLSEVVEKYKIGIAVDFKENFYEVIEKYIDEFNSYEFNKNANILLYKVLCDQKKIKEKVKYFIKYGEKNDNPIVSIVIPVYNVEIILYNVRFCSFTDI